MEKIWKHSVSLLCLHPTSKVICWFMFGFIYQVCVSVRFDVCSNIDSINLISSRNINLHLFLPNLFIIPKWLLSMVLLLRVVMWLKIEMKEKEITLFTILYDSQRSAFIMHSCIHNYIPPLPSTIYFPVSSYHTTTFLTFHLPYNYISLLPFTICHVMAHGDEEVGIILSPRWTKII